MIIGVIPARLESTRFPRKILFPIRNKPMIMHVYERALKANKLDRVMIAVDSQDTIDELNNYDVEIVLTSTKHQSGTDRIAEAVTDIDAEIVINIQGDEPMLDPNMIDDLISVFDDETVEIATLASTLITEDDFNNPNTVKVKIDNNSNAIDFYRETDSNNEQYFRHIGIYGYRKNILEKFTSLEKSDNEQSLHLEQLRALDNGISIRVAMCNFPFRGIDTREDLKQLNI